MVSQQRTGGVCGGGRKGGKKDLPEVLEHKICFIQIFPQWIHAQPVEAEKDDVLIFLTEFLFKGRQDCVPVGCAEDVGRILRTFKIKKNVEVTDNGKDNF